MTKISLNNGATRIDCDDLTDQQAELVCEYVCSDSVNNADIDEMREIAAYSCDESAKKFVTIFCAEYTKRTGEVYTLP